MQIKVWQVILVSSPLLGLGAYLSYRYSPTSPELDIVDKALSGSTLTSVKLVADSSDFDSAVPMSEIQRTYVLQEPIDKVRTAVTKSLRGTQWHEVFGCGNGYYVESKGYTYSGFGPSILYSNLKDGVPGSITFVKGKYSPETPFGTIPREENPEYTIVYVSWVKEDPISKAIAMIKVK